MHEGHFTEEMVEAIIQELKKYPGSVPVKIRISAGEMLHLIPESVSAHFAALTNGTSLGNAVLEMEEIPVRVECSVCGRVFHPPDHHMLLCESCGSLDVEILEGNRLIIESIEFESESGFVPPG